MATDHVLKIAPASEREPSAPADPSAGISIVGGLRGYLERCHAAGKDVLSEDIGLLGLGVGMLLAISKKLNTQPMREVARPGMITIHPPETFVALDDASRAALFNRVNDIPELGSLLELEVSGS